MIWQRHSTVWNSRISRWRTGEISQLEYRTQTNTTEISRLKVEVAELNLFQAMETYDWKVNGLAGS